MNKLILICLIIFLFSQSADAWIFHEHRKITMAAIEKLDTERADIFNKLWIDAVSEYESRLSSIPADTGLNSKSTKLDYAAWAAIGGDHSCSASQMLNEILYTEWIVKVFQITSRYSKVMPFTFNLADISNLMRNQDIELQLADPEYATRAGSNNSHFLLARPRSYMSGREYANYCFKTGQDINAVGVYVMFHITALNKIHYLGTHKDLPDDIRKKILIAAFADEAFALHFLEDIYAAGHVAGTWGNAALRKGTHDYYNQHGLEISTWNGKSFIIMGDAHLRHEDIDSCSNNLLISLNQFIDAYKNNLKINYPPLDVGFISKPDTFNVCKNNYMPALQTFEQDTSYNKYLAKVLAEIPKPELAEGKGALPRFRAELGPFVGISSAAQFNMIVGGFGADNNSFGFNGALDIAARFGLGLEGVVNETADGLIFLDVGFKINSKSSSLFCQTEGCQILNQISAMVPARNAVFARLRMPYFVVPGDLILGLPLVGLIWPKSYESMAIIAANGGIIPWQTVMITSIGKFQFILGREVAATFYGSLGSDNAFVRPLPEDDDNLLIFSVHSLALEFPIIEYRPFRTFSFDQSTSLRLQLYGGVEFPTSVTVENPLNYNIPSIGTVWSFGFRLVFDWRYYL
jgi:hypothetical protein